MKTFSRPKIRTGLLADRSTDRTSLSKELAYEAL